MSTIKIQLADDRVLSVQRVDAPAWKRAFANALKANTALEVHDPDGRTLAINPHQILFWEEVPEDSAQAARQPQPA
jgi:hypothetical protein